MEKKIHKFSIDNRSATSSKFNKKSSTLKINLYHNEKYACNTLKNTSVTRWFFIFYGYTGFWGFHSSYACTFTCTVYYSMYMYILQKKVIYF